MNQFYGSQHRRTFYYSISYSFIHDCSCAFSLFLLSMSFYVSIFFRCVCERERNTCLSIFWYRRSFLAYKKHFPINSSPQNTECRLKLIKYHAEQWHILNVPKRNINNSIEHSKQRLEETLSFFLLLLLSGVSAAG